jgi:hypothetical protein
MPEITTLGPQIAATVKPYMDQYVAGEDLSALRVVRLGAPGQVVLARPPELEAQAPLGITTIAANAGGTVTVRSRGELQDNSWSWSVGQPVLLGLDGALTQAQPPGLPVLLVVGFATALDTMVVRIGTPLTLAP